MDQNQYVEWLRKQTTEDNIKIILAEQDKYGTNRWWLSSIPEVVGYFQLFEDYLMVPIARFQEGLEKLLKRPVFTHELATNREQLKEHARKAKDLLLTDEDISEGIRMSFASLEKFANDRDVKIIGIQVGRRNA